MTIQEILPNETEITGEWIFENGKMHSDDSCKKIDYLVDNYLEKIATADNGWEKLYKDPNDNRLWEKTFPQSHMQGGGPPQLKHLTEQEAREKYKF